MRGRHKVMAFVVIFTGSALSAAAGRRYPRNSRVSFLLWFLVSHLSVRNQLNRVTSPDQTILSPHFKRFKPGQPEWNCVRRTGFRNQLKPA
jgi:hypothetical protein